MPGPLAEKVQHCCASSVVIKFNSVPDDDAAELIVGHNCACTTKLVHPNSCIVHVVVVR